METEFGDSLHFFTFRSRLYIRPDNYSVEDLSKKVVLLQQKLDEIVKQQDDSQAFTCTALKLREQIESGTKTSLASTA